jgi:hypothetical protein
MKRVAPDGPSSESPAINIPTDSKKWTNVIVQLEDPHERPDEKQAEVKPQPQKQRKLGNKSLYAVFGMRTNDSQCAQAEIYIQGEQPSILCSSETCVIVYSPTLLQTKVCAVIYFAL